MIELRKGKDTKFVSNEANIELLKSQGWQEPKKGGKAAPEQDAEEKKGEAAEPVKSAAKAGK